MSVDPANAAGNNQYVVVVTATSGAVEREKTATQTITVTVTDVDTEAPGKPNAPTVSAASATSLTVTWSAPANDGPAITDYDYRHRTSPDGSWTEVTDTAITAPSATITGLTEGTSYDVQVRATNDEGTGDWSDSGTESTDANAAPSFDSSATFSAAENQTVAGTVRASDSDTGDDITGYAITGGADQAFFSIGATSGALTFDAAPNFEDAKDIVSVDPANAAGNNQYVVVVTATSGAVEREKTATQTITVTVTDAGGEAPGKPAAPTVSAASATSLTVTWSAPANDGPAITDYDYRHRTSPDGSWTEVTDTAITAPSATITGLTEGTSYDVQVRAMNDEGTGDWSDSGTESTDANAAPSFDSSATFSAAENQTVAGTVRASDSDTGDDITGYAITGGADQAFFSIGATSGALTFDAAPNFEDAKDIVSVDPANAAGNNQYVVVVTATSGAVEREKTATQTITVTVTDVDTEAPGKPAAPNVSAASATSLNVSWSAPANAGPAITDYDHRHRTSPDGSWTEVTDTAITALSATITGLADGTSYDVQVRAMNDEGTGAWSDSGTESTDANAAPAFDSSATFSAAENQTVAGTVRASDSDTGDDITGYAITGGADQAFFSIGATSGALTFDAAPNFEDAKDIVSVDPANAAGNNQYVVVVTATSGAVEREKTATQTITVTVTDAGGEAPGKPAAPNVSAASATSLNVSWSAPANDGPAITDYDHRHRTSPAGSWTEVAGTGSTALSATIAGLADGTAYDVQVRATNDEGTGAWSDSGTESTDANAAPAFSSSATFDAAENQTVAGTVEASDSDTGDNITGYEITGGADQTFFSIGATDGALTFQSAPNYEDAKDQGTNNTYVVVVQATSGAGERVKTATQTITVTVTDIDTEAPGKPAAPNVSAASATSLSVSWSAPSNAGPAITDYDHRHRTTSPEGNWTEVTNTTITAPSATIAGLTEGTSYDVQVRATNDEGTGDWSESGTGATDANAAPSFDSSATFSAAENQTAAGTVEATDDDTGDDITGYEITGGADQPFFSIGATSGALTFDAAPNFEDPDDANTDGRYQVTVEATSGAGEREKTATQTITVTVTDMGGEAPGKPAAPSVSAASATSLTVSWSAPSNAGPAITDYDHRHRASPAGNWTEVTNTTSTALSATIAGLAEGTSYDVQVRATNDEGTGAWSDSGTGSTDANAAPSFDSPSTFNAAENQTAAGTVVASDSDSEDKIERYDITGGADQALFMVIASSGDLEFRDAPNFEDAKDQDTNNTYVVEVQATSGAGTREKTATQTITVTVTDAAGEAPGKPAAPDVSAASVTSLTVNWSAPSNAGPAITDYDVQYREGTSGDWTDAGHTGDATTATLTGLSENTSYQVQVRATNAEGTGSWSDSGSGATDANAAPSFSSNAAFDAAENQTVAGTVLATDSDADDDVTGYAITGGADQALFSIGATDGALTFDAAPNFEDAKDQGSNNTYVVEVQASSGAGEREKTATQTITVTVTDVNTEAPGKPDAPAVTAASVTSLTVNWSAPSNAGPPITDYDVQVREEGRGGFTDAQHDGPGLSLTLSDLEPGTVYEVQVRATNEEGTSGWSDAGEGMTVTPLTVVMGSGTDPPVSGAFTVRFSFSEPVTGFSRSDIDSSQDRACEDDLNNPVFCDPGIGGLETTDDRVFTTTVTPQTDRVAHSYALRLTVGGGAVRSSAGNKPNEEPEEPLEVRVSPPGAPEPISTLSLGANGANGSVRLSWSRPSDNGGSPIIRYEYRYAATGEAWSQWEQVGAGSSGVTVGNLINGREYVFEVRSVNALGKGGTETVQATPEQQVTPPPPPGGGGGGLLFPPEAPAGLMATAGDGAVRLEWSPPASDGGTPILRYEYRLKEGRGEFGEWTSIPDSAPGEVNATGYTVGGLGNGTVHVFELRAVNAAGNGQALEAVEVRMPLDPAYWSNFRAEDLEGARLMLEAFLSSGSSGDRELRFGEGLRFEEDELDGEGEVTATRMGGYGYRYTSRTTGRLQLDFDVGEACELRLTFTGEGTGSYVYRCGGALVGQGSFRLSELVNRVPEITSVGPFEVEENTTRAGQLEAVDWDEEDEITGYGIAGGVDGALFTVEAETGELSFREAPDYETPRDVESEDPQSPAADNEYVVVVEVRSGEGERERRREQAIRVRVSDQEQEGAGEEPAPDDPSNFTAGDLEGERLTLRLTGEEGAARSLELRFGEGNRFEHIESGGQQAATKSEGASRSGAYSYEKTGPGMGTVSLDYDDGASCEIRLSFTESGLGGFTYDCGEGDPGEGSFRLTTGSLFIPVILSSAGRNQSFFTSELTLTNRGEQEVSLDYTYTAKDEPGRRSGKASDVLPAGRQRIETDALTYLRGLGVPIPETGNQLGTLRVEVPLGSEVEAVVRTTTVVPDGRAGLAYLGVTEEEGFEEPVYLCGLRQNSRDRSNLAFQNMGAPEAGAITLRTTVYSGEAADATARVLREVELEPGGFHQYSPVLGSVAHGYVKVERVEGTAPFYAYGVINDQVNSDGSFVFPVTASSLEGKRGQTLPVIVETSEFRSELTVTNFSEEPRRLDFRFVADQIKADDKTAGFSMTLQGGQQEIIPEVVQELRRQGVAGLGATRGFYAGALFVTAQGGDLSGIVIGARTGSEGGGGSYSVFYNAVPEGEAFAKEAWVDGLQQNRENRSNLALVNTGEVDESPTVFHLEIYDGETGMLVQTVVTRPIPAQRWHQINGILLRASPETRQGYIRIEKVSGENPFLAYGVVNDGGAPGERSGDGAYVPARE